MNTCPECKSTDFYLDDVLGELSCTNCGYVLEDEMIEGTQKSGISEVTGHFDREITRDYLGSLIGKDRTSSTSRLRKTESRFQGTSFSRTLGKGISFVNMTCAEFTKNQHLKEEARRIYTSAIKSHKLRGANYEERAAAVVFFLLKDQNFAVTLDEVSLVAGCKTSRASKYAKEIAAHMRKPYVLHRRNIRSEIEKYALQIRPDDYPLVGDCIDVAFVLQNVYEENNIPITKSFFAISIYFTNLLIKRGLTQARVCEGCKISEVSLRNNVKKILNILGIPNRHYLSSMTIDEFKNGVRNE